MSTAAPTITRPPIASPMGHPGVLVPTHEQASSDAFRWHAIHAPVIYASIVFIVVISAVWHIPGARTLINPLKLFTIGFHELCHMVAAIFTGGRITSISIDPNSGGCTRVEGGHPPTILTAGYLGSTLIGAGLIIAGWDTLAAKIASFPVAIGIALPLILVRDIFTIILIFIYEGLLIGFWFINHADALRYYCLFLGIMSIFYVVWDFVDDRFFKKVNDSDATQFSLLYPNVPPHYWATGWFILSSLTFIAMLLVGIAVFKKTPGINLIDFL
ncbi:pre-mRNA-splicing factor CWC22 [Ceratobasidium sp. AG-Ba]|nr:pre-mRNA-splicing factor CWC22 [Ceratobasidium sp. AG-Ba]